MMKLDSPFKAFLHEQLGSRDALACSALNSLLAALVFCALKHEWTNLRPVLQLTSP
ncbi:hypothetical protein [Paraburkholderia sp. CI3]|uniref:hypothetical protein n=1 Tax=Paraburkholderia sp. CI3 TaxID=2991060 RepID=UPI003D24F1B6